MKYLYLTIAFSLFFIVSCASDNEDYLSCTTILDCPPNYSCIDFVCVPSESGNDGYNQEGETSQSENSDKGNNDQENNFEETDSASDFDSSSSEENEEESEQEDKDDDSSAAVGCLNDCSNFGTCDPNTLTCLCNEFHTGDDCSECISGYHMESKDDDENGDGVFSCVENKACSDNPNPCHGNGCKDTGVTVICTCRIGYTGRWCDQCEAGYLMSKLDETCKKDCETGDFSCGINKKCSVDEATNEAGCNICAEYYSGNDCTSCDTAHFCNGHAQSCTFSGSAPTCTCLTGWAGANCSGCEEGNVEYNGNCVKDCDPKKCFQEYHSSTPFPTTIKGHGTCDYSTGSGVCICDPGWKNGLFNPVFIDGEIQLVKCGECDKSNPPPEYQEHGCEATCGDGVCENGKCYYETTGGNQIYCVCDSGYTLNGDQYSGTCVAN